MEGNKTITDLQLGRLFDYRVFNPLFNPWVIEKVFGVGSFLVGFPQTETNEIFGIIANFAPLLLFKLNIFRQDSVPDLCDTVTVKRQLATQQHVSDAA